MLTVKKNEDFGKEEGQPVDRSHPFNFVECKSFPNICSRINKHQSGSETNKFSCQFANLEAFECSLCDFNHQLQIAVHRHVSLVHEGKKNPIFEPDLHLCNTCGFKTFSLLIFGKHVSHCDINEESFKTKTASSLVRRKLIEENETSKRSHVPNKYPRSEQMEWFKCEHCPYKSKRKFDLKTHIYYRHTEVSEWFKCEHCEYKAKKKFQLKNHVHLKHLELIDWFACDQCDYKTKTKFNLKSHVYFKHSPVTKWFKCEQCDYKAKKKNNLQRHVYAKHTQALELFECDQCDYKTKTKFYLKSHVYFKHSAAVKWFECDQCDYKAKKKNNLNRHVYLKHSQKERS